MKYHLKERESFFPNSNSFGVFSHSKGFAAGLLSDSPWLVLWGRSVLGCQKVPRKVPPRFHQGPGKVPPGFHQVPPSFSKFRGVSGFLGRSVLGCQKVPRKAPPPWFHKGFTEVVSSKFRICLPNRCCFKTGSSWSDPQKTPHPVVAVGVFFGFILIF